MITFKLTPHSGKAGNIIEIWRDDVFIACIYPYDPNGIKIVSKYFPDRLDRLGEEFVHFMPDV